MYTTLRNYVNVHFQEKDASQFFVISLANDVTILQFLAHEFL